LPKRFGVEKRKQFGRGVDVLLPVKKLEPTGDFLGGRGIEPRSSRHLAKRSRIGSASDASAQGGFQWRGAPPHEWIINRLAGVGESVDERAGQFRLEAGAVGNLMQRVTTALACGPKFSGFNKAAAQGSPASIIKKS
jgi:hypothetical protein